MWVPGAEGGQKRLLNPLGLDLQAVVSCRVGAGNQTYILCRATRGLNYQSISPAPNLVILTLPVFVMAVLSIGLFAFLFPNLLLLSFFLFSFYMITVKIEFYW